MNSEETCEIFLSIIQDGLNAREISLEGEVFPEYKPPKENNSSRRGKLIGFYSSPRDGERSVALYPNPTFAYVQSTLRIQGEQMFDNMNDVWAQLYNEGYINKVDKTNKYYIRYDALVVNEVTGRQVRAINFEPSAVLGEPVTNDDWE